MNNTSSCIMHKVVNSHTIESIGFMRHPDCKRTHYERRGVLVVQFKTRKGGRGGLYYYADVNKLTYCNIRVFPDAYFNSLVKSSKKYKRVDIPNQPWRSP